MTHNTTIQDYGYFRVAACVPQVTVANVEDNVSRIIDMATRAGEQGAQLAVFPELAITGYTCGDLFHNSTLLSRAAQGIEQLKELTRKLGTVIVVGAPLRHGAAVANCAVVLGGGEILGIVPKTYLPNYKEFYEKRWFASASDLAAMELPWGKELIFNIGNARVAIEVCEDLWVPVTPGAVAALNGANVIVNLSASNELIGKHNTLKRLIAQCSKSYMAAYVYASAGCGESTTDLVFGGNAIIAEGGSIVCEGKRFAREAVMEITDIDIEALDNERRVSTSFSDNAARYKRNYCHITAGSAVTAPAGSLMHKVKKLPFVPTSKDDLDSRCREIVSIQASGLMKRLECTRISQLVVGISGGLDSTLALLVAVEAFDTLGLDRRGITGITMPGFGTTGRTHSNALTLMDSLGVSSREISIVPAVEQHFKDIGQDPDTHDVTYENSQARERTQILMDYANKINALVLGTGDLSELALGWATYNGDHMSMYNVNCSIPKTLVRHLVSWFAAKAQEHGDNATSTTLLDVLDTPISPELTPADEHGEIKQKTEDLVGPYELHDFFLYNMIRHNFGPAKIFLLARKAFEGQYDNATILKWLTTFMRRFFNQQFKRSCVPDGPKVGSVSLSPRGDWRMPSDASSAMWLNECEALKEQAQD